MRADPVRSRNGHQKTQTDGRNAQRAVRSHSHIGLSEPKRELLDVVWCESRTLSQKSEGYCWPTYFKVLEVLFLGEVSPAFLPSKQACWTHKFRHLGVGQQ